MSSTTTPTNKYEVVIGLEVHCQLLTESKAFSTDPYLYGSEANTQVSPVSLGHPGTLPKPNLKALEYALKMGLACHCDIHEWTHFARKNYFYADLPKAYQVTQFTKPIATEGYITINLADGTEKNVKLDKIIMEEDSGKTQHDLDPFSSLIDLNRAGVPLIEVVSQPDLFAPEEAYQYLTELRRIVRYLGICDGNMEEGSLRCDANVSIRLKGTKVLNTRVEVKNLNSFRNVQRAIEYEMERQAIVYDNGGTVDGETRGFDPAKGETFMMRSKEMMNDYRYFPEPDIPPFVLTQDDITKVKKMLPELPRELHHRMVTEMALSTYDAGVITSEKSYADFYLTIINHTKNYKAAANWLNGPIRSYLNENALDFKDFKVTPEAIADLIKVVDENVISFSTASQKVFPELIAHPEIMDAMTIVNKLNLGQVGDDDLLITYIQEAIAKYPDKVAAYKNGQKGLIGLFMGEVMKKTGGKADPKKTNALLAAELEKA
ncbi:MAG: Asp-tRNA(Asn)/Glu-tRNA(Gln) amidotransferase subunit GatB [Bacteroidetes bacterium]|nr:Asp-tRNA(Asn)/Glu-tRNA(Gln) amidotransferase subunit GatB [Bacteroidota bacterium]